MKKITLFLIIMILLLIVPVKTVEAKSSSFYEGEYIPNIWMHKKNQQNGIIYYNQARIFRETTTNNIAYCIEPFVLFNTNETYESTQTPNNYTQKQITEMSLIAHFGYGYQNHTEQKWYAITQYMLWKVLEPTGYYYFSTIKNGPEQAMFKNEINELTTLVNNYKKQISFNKNTYYIVEGETLTLTDTNNVLRDYKISSSVATIEDNNLIINATSPGTYTITMQKENSIYNKPILFYQSESSQDILTPGDPTTITNEITINVINTNLNITKLDKETTDKTPQGDALLEGTEIDIYTTDDKRLKTLTIDEKSTASTANLPFGTYYLKEKTPGKGYTVNETKYYFTLSKDSPNANIEITNEVIKGKLLIKKEYGYEGNFKPEQNISFNIYNKENQLIKTIMTNSDGFAEITLPYGKYKLTQLTTTEGYAKIEPIHFEITSEETVYYNLKDYKIPVPNTNTKSFFHKVILLLKELLCGKN